MARFAERNAAVISEIDGFVAAGELRAVYSAAHNLKGEAGNLGLEAIAACAESLEQDAQAERMETLAATSAELQAEFIRIRDGIGKLDRAGTPQ